MKTVDKVKPVIGEAVTIIFQLQDKDGTPASFAQRRFIDFKDQRVGSKVQTLVITEEETEATAIVTDTLAHNKKIQLDCANLGLECEEINLVFSAGTVLV